jgi:hypothetical protein
MSTTPDATRAPLQRRRWRWRTCRLQPSAARTVARAHRRHQGRRPGLRAAQLSLQRNQPDHRLFTRDFGRVALIAKGAKRPHSQLRGVLQTFQPLSSGWVGKSELRTLTDAEWVGGMLPLEKPRCCAAFT